MQSVLKLDEFKACARILAASTGRPMPSEQADSYLLLLQDIPFEILRGACIRAIQEARSTFIPAVGAIRAIAAELQFGILPSGSTEWSRVMDCCFAFGVNGEAKAQAEFVPHTWAIVSEMGWKSICQTEQPDIVRSQFIRLYDACASVLTVQRAVSAELRTGIAAAEVKLIEVTL